MVDITLPIYQLPEDTTSQMYQVVKANQASDITTGAIGGTGVFDLLMAGMKAQLEAEYQNGRITGADYTKTYIELTQIAMQTALQFVMSNSGSYWQAQNAQIQAITGRIALETARYNYLNTLPTQQATAAYNLNYTLPAQLANLQEQLQLITEQADAQRGQTSNTRLDGSAIGGVMGAQKALYNQQITSYQRDAEVKAAKIFSDAWITQKTIDNGVVPPTCFTNDSVNEILAAVMGNNFPGMSPVA